MESQYRVDFREQQWEAPIPGVRHILAQRENTVLRIVEYTKQMDPHWCKKGHVGIILEGRFKIEYENETVVYSEGDGVFIPSGEKHRHKASVLTDRVRMFSVEEA